MVGPSERLEAVFNKAVKDAKKILGTTVPSMYTTEFSGQAETMEETRNSFLFAFFLAHL